MFQLIEIARSHSRGERLRREGSRGRRHGAMVRLLMKGIGNGIAQLRLRRGDESEQRLVIRFVGFGACEVGMRAVIEVLGRGP